MASKNIDLGNGLKFESITAGKMHFEPILKDAALGKHFAGQEFQDIKALYDAYCRETGWLVASPPAAFFPKHEGGPGYTTRCFGIEFDDGSSGRFSLDKALSAVAVKSSGMRR
jgi:hypothetical protein